MITNYQFEKGEILADKYEMVNYLGGGWEGEVYRIKELGTKIDRAAKIFYPKRNVNSRAANIYAKKLHKLRNCPVLIKYHTTEKIQYEDNTVTAFISEYVEGKQLTEHLKTFRGNTLPIYQGLHLLHALAVGVESIHDSGEYHGDLHAENVIVERLNLKYEIKLLDLINLGGVNKANRHNDILAIIKIFYDAIGGQKKYSKHPAFVKSICCGLKKGLILKKFTTIKHLRRYLEANEWR